MGDLSDIEREQIVDAHLAGASVISDTVLCVSRATVSKVMLSYINNWKTHHRKGTVVEKQR
jgi:hypothetical protein